MSAKERKEKYLDRDFRILISWNEHGTLQTITVIVRAMNPASAVCKVLPRLSPTVTECMRSICISEEEETRSS